METAPVLAEQAPRLDFATIDNLQALRDKQVERLQDARSASLENAPALAAYSADRKAKEAVYETFDADAEAFAASCVDKESDPEKYAKLVAVARNASIDGMSQEKWLIGTADNDGKHSSSDTNSGKAEAQAIFDALHTSLDPSGEAVSEPEASPEKLAAQEELAKARVQLAELGLKVRRLHGNGARTKKSRSLIEQYESAKATHDAARAALGGILVNEWREQGLEGPELLREITTYTLQVMQKLSMAEAGFLDLEKGFSARISRWLSEGRGRFIGANVALGAGVGFGTKALVAGAVGVGSAIALPAALGAGVAIKTVKGVLNANVGSKVHQRKRHTALAEHDFGALRSNLESDLSDDMSHEDLLEQSGGLLSDRLHARVHEDRRTNAKRMWIAAGAAALGGAAGAYAAEHINFGSGHDSPPAKPSTSGPTHEPGPGNTIKPHAHEVAGFKTGATVESGHGYTDEIQDLAEQKGIHLSGSEAWEAYQHMNHDLHGNFMHTAGDHNASYRMSDGNWGIRPVGHVTWNPAALHNFQQFLAEHPELTESSD